MKTIKKLYHKICIMRHMFLEVEPTYMIRDGEACIAYPVPLRKVMKHENVDAEWIDGFERLFKEFEEDQK